MSYTPDSSTASDGVTLELEKTHLQINNGELQRINKNGKVALRLPLTEVESVDFRRYFDPIGFVFSGIGLGLGAIGMFVSENNILTCLLYIAAVLVIGFAVIGSVAFHIIINTTDGETRVQCNDLPDEGWGFVTSMRYCLRNRNQPGMVSQHSVENAEKKT